MASAAHFRSGSITCFSGINMTSHALAMIGFLTVQAGLVMMTAAALDVRITLLEGIFVQDVDTVLHVMVAIQTFVEPHVQIMGKHDG